MVDKLARVFAALPVALAVIGSLTVASVQWVLAATVFVIGGVGWETVDDTTMRAVLGSRFDKPENTFVNIEWPAYMGTMGETVDAGSDSLYQQITTTDGPKIAVGLSGSTLVMNEVMKRLADDPNPDKPTPDEVSFVIIGDAERGLIPALVPLTGPDLPLVNYTAQPIPVTPYDAIVVKGEYDGLADWPDRPLNLLALVNAVVGSPAVDGFGEIHWDSIFNSLDTIPAENITTEVNSAGGTTTTYLVPTKELPLLYPLREQGVPEEAIVALNSVLKPIVDSGYSRNDPPWLKDLSATVASALAPAPAPAPARTVAAPVAAVGEPAPAVDMPEVDMPELDTPKVPPAKSVAAAEKVEKADKADKAERADRVQARRRAAARAAATN